MITDLDETRRLLVVAIWRPSALSSDERFGTLVHALDKHSHLMDAQVAADMLTRYHGSRSGLDELERLVNTIDQKLERLGSLPMLAPLE
jgi:hypothetical protein